MEEQGWGKRFPSSAPMFWVFLHAFLIIDLRLAKQQLRNIQNNSQEL